MIVKRVSLEFVRMAARRTPNPARTRSFAVTHNEQYHPVLDYDNTKLYGTLIIMEKFRGYH